MILFVYLRFINYKISFTFKQLIEYTRLVYFFDIVIVNKQIKLYAMKILKFPLF